MADKKVKESRIVEMKFENGNFEKNAKKSMSTLDKLEQKLKFKGVKNGAKDINDALNSIDVKKLDKALDTINYRLSTVGVVGAATLGKAVDTLGDKLNNLFDTILTKGENRARNIENATFSLKGLITEAEGGAKKVEEIMGKNGPVRAAVAGTRFGLDEAAGAAAMFFSAGIKGSEELEAALTAVSGVATLTNSSYSEIADIMAAIATRGKLSGNEIQRFTSRNFAILEELAKHFETSAEKVQEMVRKGEVTAETVFEVLQKYADASKKANDTYDGALDNLGAALARIGDDIMANWREVKRKVFIDLITVLDEFDYALTDAITSLNGFMNLVYELSHAFLTNYQLIASIMLIFNGFGRILQTLAFVVDQAKKAFAQLFGELNITDPIVAFAKAFDKLTGLIERFTFENADAIKEFFLGFFSSIRRIGNVFGRIGKVIFSIIGGIVKGIKGLVGGIKSLHDAIDAGGFFDAIGTLFKSLGDGLKPFWDMFKGFISYVIATVRAILPTSEEITNTFTNISAAIEGFAKASGNRLKYIADQIKGFFTSITGFELGKIDPSSVTDRFAHAGEIIKAAIDGVKQALSELFGIFSKGKAEGEDGIKMVLDAETVTSNVKNAILMVGNAIKKIYPYAIQLIKLFIAYKFSDGFQKFGKGFQALGGKIHTIIDTISKTLKDIQSKIKNFGKKQVNIFHEFAKGMLELAIAFAIIAIIPADKVEQASKVMIGFFAGMVIMLGLAAKAKITDSKSIQAISKALVAIGVAFLLMATTMKKLSKIDPDKMNQAMQGFLVITLGIIGIITFIAGEFKGGVYDTKALLAAAVAIYIIAGAMRKMAVALGTMQSFDPEQMWLSATVLMLCLTLMSTLLAHMAKTVSTADGSSASYLAASVGIFIVASALVVLSTAIEKLGLLPFPVIVQGGIAVAAMIAILTETLRDMAKDVDWGELLAGGVAIGIVCIALKKLAPVIAKLGKLPIDQLAAGGVTLTLMLIAMAGALYALAKDSDWKDLLGAGAAMIEVAAALWILKEAILPLCEIPWEDLFPRLIALAIGLAEMAVAVYILSKHALASIGGAFALDLVALSIIGLAGAMYIMSQCDMDKVAEGMKMVGIAFGVFVAVATVLGLLMATGIGELIAAGFAVIEAAALSLAGAMLMFGLGMLALGKGADWFADAMETIQSVDAQKVADALQKIGEGLQNIGGGFIGKLDLVGTAGALFAAGIGVGAIAATAPSAAEAIWSFADAMQRLMSLNLDKFKTAVSEIYNQFLNLKSISGDVTSTATGMQQLTNAIAGINTESKETSGSFETLYVAIEQANEDFKNLDTSIILDKFNGVRDSINSQMSAVLRQFVTVGKYLVDGIIMGMGEKESAAYSAAYSLGNKLKEGVMDALDEHSPSKEMIKLGNYAADGLRIGVKQYNNIVTNSGRQLGVALLSGVQQVAGYNKGGKYKKYLEGITGSIKKFVKNLKITKFSNLANSLYLKSDDFKDNVKELKEYYKEYNDTYKESQKNLELSKRLSGDDAEQARNDYKQNLKDLKKIEEEITKMGKKITSGPAKALKKFRKELRQTIKDYLSVENMDFTKYLDISSDLEKSSNLSNLNNLVDGLTGSLQELSDVNKATSDQFDLLSTSTETGISLLERFGKVSSMTVRRLMTNAKSQLKAYQEYSEAIEKLHNMGLDEQFVNELAAKGPEGLNYMRGFLRMDSAQIQEYNGYIQQQRQYESEQLKKNMDSTINTYEQYYADLEELAARGLNEGIIKRLKEGGIGQATFVRSLAGMPDDYFGTINDYYAESVQAMDDINGLSNDVNETFKSVGELLDYQIFKKNIWNLMLVQLKDKGVDADIIKYFKDAGYDSMHTYVESILRETDPGIKDINKKWAAYKESESKSAGINWLSNLEDSKKVASDYKTNLEKVAKILPKGKQNPLYQELAAMGAEDGAEYAEAFVNADKATRDSIIKAHEENRKLNAELAKQEFETRMASVKNWAANLKKIANDTYKKSGDGHKKGDAIIGQELMSQLVAMGPEAADQIQMLADMSHKELAAWAEEYNYSMTDFTKNTETQITKSYANVAGTAVKSFKDYMKKPETVDELQKAVDEAVKEASEKNKTQLKKTGKKDGKQYVGNGKDTGFTGQVNGDVAADAYKNFYDSWKKEDDKYVSQYKWGDTAIKGPKQYLDEFLNQLGIHSPSRKAKEAAMYFAKGFRIGMDDSERDFLTPANQMASGVLNAFSGLDEKIQNGTIGLGISDMSINITPTAPIDLSKNIQQASQISDIFSSISGVNFEIGRDANRDVVNAINDMRSDFQGQFNTLSQTISEMQLVMDSGALVGQIANPMNEALGQRIALAQRGVTA